MSLDAGGHLTHGAAPNLSGKWFNAVQYGVRRQDGLIDYDQVASRIAAFWHAGIELFMLQFQPFEPEMTRFAHEIRPRVRRLTT